MIRLIAARTGAIIFALLLYYAIQFPSMWAGLWNPWGAPPSWQANGQWLYMVIHHVAQALLALVAIGLLSGFRFSEWGLNLRDLNESMRLVRTFTVWFGVIIGVSLGLQLASGAPPIYSRPLTADHIIGGLAFMWLISGTSEEILFRALFQTWFARFWTSTASFGRVVVPTAGIVAAIFFALVHVNFRLWPFEITHFAPMQVLIALVLGIFYAVAYHRTGSILAPALTHSIANGLMETSNLVVAASS